MQIYRPIPSQQIKLLIFDLDGTLIDSRQDLVNSVNAALRSLGRAELPSDEIAALVKDRNEKMARGEEETNQAFRQLALQGGELMQRVTAARQIYDDLRKTAAIERPIRQANAAK